MEPGGPTAGQDAVAGVVAGGQQVAGSGQTVHVVATHDLTPFGFAQGEDAPPLSWFLRREDRDIDFATWGTLEV